MKHLKPIEDLDYLNFKIPCTENKLKDILKCTYADALKLDIDEVNRRIQILKDIMNDNVMDYNNSECWIIGNMENNYQFILKELEIKQNSVDNTE